MSFPTASRFLDYLSIYSPGPNTYNIPSRFNGIGPNGISTRYCSLGLDPHKCDKSYTSDPSGRCLKDVQDAKFLKKHVNSKRDTLEPRSTNFKEETSTKPEDKKQLEVLTRKSLNFNSPENKENLPTPLRKQIVSSIPRFKKTVTEGKAPSLMSRPRNIHFCLKDIDEENSSHLTSNFNRNSLKRKIIKHKKNEEKNTQLVKRPFNVSYTVIPKIEEKPPIRLNQSASVEPNSNVSNIIKDIKEINRKGQLINKTKSPNKNFNVLKSPNVLSKNLQLKNELLFDESEAFDENTFNQKLEDSKIKKSEDIVKEVNNSKNNDVKLRPTNETGETFKKEDKDGLRSHDIFALQDCNLILLVNEEFIDDEYDSYIPDFNTFKAQVMQNNELYEITKSLVRIYLETNTVSENSLKTPKKNINKIQKSIGGKIGKYLNKRKKNIKVNNQKNHGEITRIVRRTIEELKGEFQREIFNKTNEKLDQLVSQLKNVVFKANDDIESTCERAAENLISRLENIAL